MILFKSSALLDKAKEVQPSQPLKTVLENGIHLLVHCLAGPEHADASSASISPGYLHVLEGSGVAYGPNKRMLLVAGQGLVVEEGQTLQLVNMSDEMLKYLFLET